MQIVTLIEDTIAKILSSENEIFNILLRTDFILRKTLQTENFHLPIKTSIYCQPIQNMYFYLKFVEAFWMQEKRLLYVSVSLDSWLATSDVYSYFSYIFMYCFILSFLFRGLFFIFSIENCILHIVFSDYR